MSLYKDDKNAYYRKYLGERYRKRKAEMIFKLGGKCVKCETTDNLEIDHIDRKDKLFDLSKLWGTSQEKLNEELKKCQLLCKDCHKKKTRAENKKEYCCRGHAKTKDNTLPDGKCKLCHRIHAKNHKLRKKLLNAE